MDNDIFSSGGLYQGYTLAQLEAFVAEGRGNEKMIGEIDRRKAVAAGDYSRSTAGERLRAVREGKL